MIAVVTREGDVHGAHIVNLLRKQGRSVAVLDYALFPQRMAISFRLQGDVPQTCIRLPDGTLIESGQIVSVLNRRQAKPVSSQEVDSEAIRSYIVQESQAVLDTLPHIIPVLWVSDPDAMRIASRKAHQLIVSRRVGLETPLTLLGNDADAVAPFISSTPEDFALKTVRSSGVTIQHEGVPTPIALYTKRVDRTQLMKMGGSVSNCPAIIQAYVQKAFELRVTVVGRKLFACAIHSQQSALTRDDWRRYDLKNTPHEPYDLPPTVALQCKKLVTELRLQYGCIDMVVTPDGRYVFLEINPGGQWLWIEELTGLPISQALVDLLVDPSLS